MGCSESKSQVTPIDLYDEKLDKLFFTDSSLSQLNNNDKTDKINNSLNSTTVTKNGQRKESLQNSLNKRQYSLRRSSFDSNFSDTGSLPESSPADIQKMTTLEGSSIDTSRAKSNLTVVSMCSKKLGLDEYPEGRTDGKPSNIYWHSVVYSDMKNVVKSPDSKINKFPGMTEAAKKISLTQSIKSMKELFPDEYHFYPNSWVIPSQYEEFKEYCKNFNNKWFIVKPDDGAQGTGIYLISSIEQLTNIKDKQLIQEYIDEPFLMNDKLKFDFRVYAVIKSINPLSIYIAREGMARFCTEKYSKPTKNNFDNLYSHLTNYSLNKENSSYIHSKTLKDQLKGSKRLLSTVFHQMESHGVKTRRLWHGIKMIIIKTVLAMIPDIMLNYEHYFSDVPGPQCFQIMGFDIIVKSDGTPMLLEVNSAPSLSIDHNVYSEDISPPVRSIVDELIKVPLVRDTLLLVLNKIENHYNLLNSSEWETKSMGSMASGCEDDLAIIKKKKRPHLSEIFPGRYGLASKHLLFLDKAVYLFMQFVNIRLTMTINLSGVKNFIRKCSLSRTITQEDLEQKFIEINYYFTAKENNTTTGLPFHGFLQLLFYIAALKFNYCDDLISAMQRLLAYCESALRHFGVRSTRLRRAEIELDENANHHMEIYLLPSRIRQSKGSALSTSNRAANYPSKSRFENAKRQQQYSTLSNRTKSLPKRQIFNNSAVKTTSNNNLTTKNGFLHQNLTSNNSNNLPKIAVVN